MSKNEEKAFTVILNLGQIKPTLCNKLKVEKCDKVKVV